MEWWLALVILFGGLMVLLATGMPIAVAFLVVNIIGILIWWGGEPGLRQAVLSLRDSVATFTLLPIPLFILMGEVMFRTGIAPSMMRSVDKWIGRMPGRLTLICVASGTLFATMSGSGIASTVLLGELLVPEMEREGYKKAMTLGPIMASGALAAMIPPSAMAVLVAAVAEESIAKTLIAIIMPGLLMAALFATYITVRCTLQPTLAPPAEVTPMKLSDKLIDTARNILPLGFIIFLVTGVIILGIATPSEAAAAGTLGAYILAFIYRRLSWEMVKKSLLGTVEVSVMIFLILMTAQIFGQILAFSGASRGLIGIAIGLPVHPIGIIIGMQVVLIILGMFLSLPTMVMIASPIFMPIVYALGYDPIWFLVLFLINGELGGLSPPFGVNIYAMKGVAPPGTTIKDCVLSALPFMFLDLVAIALVIAFPQIALWLPSIMR